MSVKIENERVLTSYIGNVGVITLNKPERGNAIDNAMARQVTDAIEAITESGNARSILFRSNGSHFCTGADISDNKRDKNAPRPKIGHMLRSLGGAPHKMIETVWNCPLPTVAEVKGRTSGLGLHLSLACDYSISGESATFAEPFTERGFSVDSGGSWLLQRAIGIKRAKVMLFQAEPISAATAEIWGLVTEVVADDALVSHCSSLAQELANRSTFALTITKNLIHHAVDSSLAEALEREAHGVEITIRSNDFKEGMNAFKEKRKPKFEGR